MWSRGERRGSWLCTPHHHQFQKTFFILKLTEGMHIQLARSQWLESPTVENWSCNHGRMTSQPCSLTSVIPVFWFSLSLFLYLGATSTPDFVKNAIGIVGPLLASVAHCTWKHLRITCTCYRSMNAFSIIIAIDAEPRKVSNVLLYIRVFKGRKIHIHWLGLFAIWKMFKQKWCTIEMVYHFPVTWISCTHAFMIYTWIIKTQFHLVCM